ncbi:MAG: hypothetical protein WB421_04170 [Terriglobales bacterium]|jgi:hypothetical protein
MTLKSAFEDLRETTLQAITGCLRKLDYVSGLRNRREDYAHWGLGRVHGDPQANKALTQAHKSLVSQVLSTPIRQLVDDAELSSKMAGVPTGIYVERLRKRGPGLLPSAPGAGSARHLNSVLYALSGLVKARRKPDAIRRAS